MKKVNRFTLNPDVLVEYLKAEQMFTEPSDGNLGRWRRPGARGQAETGFEAKTGLVARARVTSAPVSRYNAAIVLAGFAC